MTAISICSGRQAGSCEAAMVEARRCSSLDTKVQPAVERPAPAFCPLQTYKAVPGLWGSLYDLAMSHYKSCGSVVALYEMILAAKPTGS